MGEPRGHGRPEGREGGTRKGPTAVDEPVGVLTDRVVAAVSAPPVESENLEVLLR